jgi:hypothetical protein
MKSSVLTFVVLSFVAVYSANVSFKNNLVDDAINGILRDFFVASSPKINVVYVGDKESLESDKLIDRVLSHKNDSLTFKVIKHNINDNSTLKLYNSSIVIFDSIESFRKIYNKTVWQTNPTKRHQHLVYTPSASLSDLELIQNGFIIDNVNFLIPKTEKSIELVSSFMFTPKACRKNQFKTINRFDKSSMAWETSNFYPNKYRNLHRCKLSYFGEGIQLTILNSFMDFVNATKVQVEFHESIRNLVDVEVYGVPWGDKIRGLDLVYGNIFWYDKEVFYIPPGELYTPLEKMILPFEDELWIAIIVTLSIGFVTIQIVNFTSKTVKSFVFGRDVESPTMNFVSIILVGSQVKTAGRNFARFIFTLFVIWCLIIRTCYQSKMFELLQLDPRKPEVKTINELFQRNFSFSNLSFAYAEFIESIFNNTENKAIDR